MKTKSRRFSGTPEVWFNENRNIVVIRSSLVSFEALYLDKPETSFWKFHAFKEAFSFDFFNGSKYLQDQGFTLIDRLK